MNKKLLNVGAICIALSGWLSSGLSHAQSDPTGKKRITDTYAITNATVITAPGKEGVKSTVLVHNGIIQGVGSNLSLPKTTRIIAGDSLYIYPGFISGASDAGITRPKDVERPDDFVSTTPPDEVAGITPWRSAMEQYSSTDAKVEDLRKAGFTIAQIIPDGGMIAGKSAVVLLGTKENSNLIKENTSMAAMLRGSRGMYPSTAVGVMAKFRDVYQNTKLTNTRSKQYASTAGVARPQYTSTYTAMQDVVDKKMPVIFSTSTDLEIRRAIKLKNELDFDLVLTGLVDYENAIDLIKSSGVPVLIKLEIPDDKAIKAQKEDANAEVKALNAKVKKAYDQAIEQAAKLDAAGVAFAFSTEGVKAGDIAKALTAMIEKGLSEESALAALTTRPANMLGLNRMAGTIEKGKLANMVMSTSPIFSEDAQIKHVMVDGHIFDYETESKKKGKSGEGNGNVVLEGNWEYTSETPMGSSGGIMAIKKEGSSYSGTITYDDPSGSGKATSNLSNIELNGSAFSCSFDVNAGGMNLTVTITGDIDGSSLKGSMSIGDLGTFPIEGTHTPSLIAKK